MGACVGECILDHNGSRAGQAVDDVRLDLPVLIAYYFCRSCSRRSWLDSLGSESRPSDLALAQCPWTQPSVGSCSSSAEITFGTPNLHSSPAVALDLLLNDPLSAFHASTTTPRSRWPRMHLATAGLLLVPAEKSSTTQQDEADPVLSEDDTGPQCFQFEVSASRAPRSISTLRTCKR